MPKLAVVEDAKSREGWDKVWLTICHIMYHIDNASYIVYDGQVVMTFITVKSSSSHRAGTLPKHTIYKIDLW